MTIRTTTDKAAVVDTQYHWRPIDSSTPRGVKLQLINERLRVATYGSVSAKETFFTHWAPLPTFK